MLTLGQPTTFGGTVTLGSATSIDPGNNGVIFLGPVDGSQSLTVNAGTGSVAFLSTVGATNPLQSLSVTGTTTTGAITLDRNVTTSGSQTYSDPVKVSSIALTSQNGSIGFTSTVDGIVVDLGATSSLAISTANGVTFGDAVGATTPLASLTVTGPTKFGAGGVSVTTNGGGQMYNGRSHCWLQLA